MRGEESNREIRHSAIAVRVELWFSEIAKVKSQQSQFRKSITRALGVNVTRFLYCFFFESFVERRSKLNENLSFRVSYATRLCITTRRLARVNFTGNWIL